MSRLRLHGDGTQITWRSSRAAKSTLIISGAISAAVVAIVYPTLGFSLNVGAVIFVTLRALAQEPARSSDRHDQESREDRTR
ncbi:hypothetical protein [Actinomadura fibrosa]|uniref:Uncharacterized protein n=1 Tax=Actinomadura fibrosa TaxID=111802 RepID=A0ABW2XMK0_9ACTN|nr:hypothetical protein [Actinomadura fibrosa]